MMRTLTLSLKFSIILHILCSLRVHVRKELVHEPWSGRAIALNYLDLHVRSTCTCDPRCLSAVQSFWLLKHVKYLI